MTIEIKEDPTNTAKNFLSFASAHMAASLGVEVEDIVPKFAGDISVDERIAELEESNRNLGAALDRKSADLGALLRDLHAAKREAEDLRRNLADLNKRYNAVGIESADRGARILDLEARVDDLKAKVDRQSACIARQDIREADLRKEHAAQIKAFLDRVKEIGGITILDLETSLEWFAEQVDCIKYLNRDNSAKDAEILALKGKLAEMQETERDRVINATNAGLDDLTKQLAGRDVEIESLRVQAAGLDILRGAIAMTLGVQAGTDLDDLVGAVAALRAEVSRLTKEQDALNASFDAWQRLKDLGWREGWTAPTDGSLFTTMAFGSTGTCDCAFQGGYFNFYEAGDVWPQKSPPSMWKPKKG